jgi:hypothetical protein
MSKPQNKVRMTDSKGRLKLGEAFANRTVIVEERADEIIVRMARVIPEREAWLYENPVALASVRRGLLQARQRRFSPEPIVRASAAPLRTSSNRASR